MLKAESKRRRTKKQIQADEQAALDEENRVRSERARLIQLEQEMQLAQQQANELQEQAARNRDAAVLMGDLVNAGVVKQKSDNSFVVQGP